MATKILSLYSNTAARRSLKLSAETWLKASLNTPGSLSCSGFFNTKKRSAFSRSARSFGLTAKNNDEERQIVLEHVSNNENVPGAVVSILTMNRPKAANAMSALMVEQLKESLSELEHQGQESRCVILASSSPRVFSAGADLKERRTMSLQEAEECVTDLRQTMHRVSNLAVPVIAAISGSALGGGLELALSADIRVASESSVMGLVETSLAIVPGAGGTQRLPRLIGLSKAKELIFTAQKISGRDAHQLGLVDHLVEAQASSEAEGGASSTSTSSPVMDKALELAWQIARNGPLAVRAAKLSMNQGMFADTMQEALDIERDCYGEVLVTIDRLEGLAAFAEKRPPQYRGE